MKKIIAVLLSLMLMAFVGCSGNKAVPIEEQAKQAVLGEWKASAMYLGDQQYDSTGVKCTVKDGIVFSISINGEDIDFDKFAYSEEVTTGFRDSFPEEDYPVLYAFKSREDSTTFLYYVDADNAEGLLMGIPASSTTETMVTIFVR